MVSNKLNKAELFCWQKTCFRMLDRLVIEKPATEIKLKKIVSANTAYIVGKQIIASLLNTFNN